VGISGHNHPDWNSLEIYEISPNFGNAIDFSQWYTDVKQFLACISVCIIKWLHIKFHITLILFTHHCTSANQRHVQGPPCYMGTVHDYLKAEYSELEVQKKLDDIDQQ
jgi:hypothetical protein